MTGASRLPTSDTSKRMAWGLVAFGVLLRLVRYLANRSLWSDEAALALNVLGRSFAELAGPLEHEQAAPYGFLVLLKAGSLVLGEGEQALRLAPFLAGVASVPLFYRLVRRFLEPRETLFALLLFAVSEPLVFYAVELKQYSSDVLVLLLLLTPAVRIAQGDSVRARALTLALLAPVAVWLSMPAVFACAGIAAWAAVEFARRREARGRALALAAAAGLGLLSFGVEFAGLLRPLYGNEYLMRSWSRFFAPFPGLEAGALAWYRDTFLGLFNDPLGLPMTGVAALAFLVGLVTLVGRNARLALLLLAPLGMGLAAALLELAPFPTSSHYHLRERHYPFFGRFILYSIPLLLPFVACGAAGFARLAGRTHAFLGAFALVLLLAAPVGQAVVNLVSPPPLQELRPLAEALRARLEPGDQLLAQHRAQPVLAYYARRYGLGPLAGVVRMRQPRDRAVLEARLRRMRTGTRFWLVSLHHPHWGSEVEQQSIASSLEGRAVPLERLEAFRAEAVLYRRQDAAGPGRRNGPAR